MLPLSVPHKIQHLLKRHGMNTSAKSVKFDDNNMWVELSDGRTLGIHWDDLNEEVSVEGLLAGRGDTMRATRIAA